MMTWADLVLAGIASSIGAIIGILITGICTAGKVSDLQEDVSLLRHVLLAFLGRKTQEDEYLGMDLHIEAPLAEWARKVIEETR